MKRTSWLDVIAEHAGAPATLTARARELLTQLDNVLFDIWSLGDNVVLAWTRDAGELRFLAVRHYAIIEAVPSPLMNSILASDKFVPPERFAELCQEIGVAAQVSSTGIGGGEDLEPKLVDAMVARYSVSLVRDRAVLLLDAVGFSLRTPLEQVGMLNSLGYSVNSAYQQLLSESVQINFARTTTGDGFYIWNRARTPGSNVALYELMMLILADNAIAASKANRFPVPQLRAAFHVGEHYEFYQVEALNPTTFGYIVGQVTIDLARLVEKAKPGQILIGDFTTAWPGEQVGRLAGTPQFVEHTATTMDRLKGLVVGGDDVERIRCYLTGERSADGPFQVARLRVRDKHGLAHTAYNAKINIHRRHSAPIYLGLQQKALA